LRVYAVRFVANPQVDGELLGVGQRPSHPRPEHGHDRALFDHAFEHGLVMRGVGPGSTGSLAATAATVAATVAATGAATVGVTTSTTDTGGGFAAPDSIASSLAVSPARSWSKDA
jgi:hypothetical protein